MMIKFVVYDLFRNYTHYSVNDYDTVAIYSSGYDFNSSVEADKAALEWISNHNVSDQAFSMAFSSDEYELGEYLRSLTDEDVPF